MKKNLIIHVFVVGMCFLVGCSKEPKQSSVVSNQERPNPPQPSNSATEAPVLEEGDKAAIAHAIQQLKDPDLMQQIKAVRELRATYSPAACDILVTHLQEKTTTLPNKLGDEPDIHLRYLLDYLGALIEEIREMDQPNGNNAVRGFMENFRLKYGQEKVGQAQLAIYESQLKTVDQGIAEGFYRKRDKEKSAQFEQMIH